MSWYRVKLASEMEQEVEILLGRANRLGTAIKRIQKTPKKIRTPEQKEALQYLWGAYEEIDSKISILKHMLRPENTPVS